MSIDVINNDNVVSKIGCLVTKLLLRIAVQYPQSLLYPYHVFKDASQPFEDPTIRDRIREFDHLLR